MLLVHGIYLLGNLRGLGPIERAILTHKVSLSALITEIILDYHDVIDRFRIICLHRRLLIDLLDTVGAKVFHNILCTATKEVLIGDAADRGGVDGAAIGQICWCHAHLLMVGDCVGLHGVLFV